MSTTYCFDRFEVQPVERRLLVDGQPAAIGARAFDLLTTLVENPGRLLTKSELLDRVWPGLVVEEANLHVQVSGLRKLLGPKVIATIPGQGYKLAVAFERAPARSLQAPQQAADGVSNAPTAPAEPAERPDDRRYNLFESSEALIGREADIEALNRLLDQHRLVTAVGTSGVGKTRLAQAVARQRVALHADGVWWVDLAALRSADQVAPALAKAAGLALGGGDVDKMLALALGRRDTLLVLDNCEHLLDAVAVLAVKLLEGAAKLRLLTTSLAPLKVPGEQVYRLEGLALPPSPMSLELARCFAAVQLLEQRAQAVDHRFRLTEETTGAAIELCRQLDGVALAIEMAAGRLPMLGPAQVLARLGDRLRLLRGSRRAAPERHQTLGATLEWSHSLLTPDEQTVLRRLAVFAGSFRLDTGLAVAAGDGLDESTVLDALCGLVDKSLLHVEGLEPPRYRLLETTRMFAVERLSNSADAVASRQRYCRAMAALAVEAEAALYTLADRPWLQRYLCDYEDVRSAFERCSEDGVVEAAADLASTWNLLDAIRGDVLNRRRRLSAAAALLPAAHGLARIKLLKMFTTTFASTSVHSGVSRLDAATELVALCRTRGDAQALYDALGRLAAVNALEGDRSGALRALAQANELERGDWPVRLLELVCRSAIGVHSLAGDTEGWARQVQRCQSLAEQGGLDVALALARMEVGELALARADGRRAVELLRDTMDRSHRLGLMAVWGYAAACSCSARVLVGELDEAIQSARSAYSVLQQFDLHLMLCNHMALWCARSGQPAEAARLLGCADAWRAVQHAALEGAESKLCEIVESEGSAALGSRAFERHRAAGAALSTGDVAALLRAVISMPGGV